MQDQGPASVQTLPPARRFPPLRGLTTAALSPHLARSPAKPLAPILVLPSTQQFSLVSSHVLSFRFSHDFHFGLQLDSALFACDILDVVNQLEYLCCGCIAIVHNEVAVYSRHARISDARVLQSEFVH